MALRAKLIDLSAKLERNMCFLVISVLLAGACSGRAHLSPEGFSLH